MGYGHGFSLWLLLSGEMFFASVQMENIYAACEFVNCLIQLKFTSLLVRFE